MRLLEFQSQIAEHVLNSKERIKKILNELPGAVKMLHEIIEDVNATRSAEKGDIETLYQTLNPVRLVLFVITYHSC